MKTTFIKFFAPVNENTVPVLMNAVDQEIRNGVEKIVLLISTLGGTVFHGLTVHNYLKGIPIEIETHNFGSVDSIGVVIFSAGKKRYTVKDSRFLLHPISFTLQAQTNFEREKLNETLKSIDIDTTNIATAIAHCTKKTKEQIISAINERTTLTSEEALKFGLVDEIKNDLFPGGANLISIDMR